MDDEHPYMAEQTATVRPIKALEEARMEDDIAAACLAAILSGMPENIAIYTALKEMIRSRAELRTTLTRYLENYAAPAIVMKP